MVCMGERVCRRSRDQMDKLKEAQEAVHIPAGYRQRKEWGGRVQCLENVFLEGWNGICEEEACGDQAV